MNRIAVATVITIGLLAAPSQAQVSNLIPFQGFLADPLGEPVADGPYSMTFKLYTVASGGSPVWTETRTSSDAVDVTDGIFNVDLGSISTLSALQFDQALFLGIAVETDSEMTPRTSLGSAAYAMSTRNISSAGTKVTVAGQIGVGSAPTTRDMLVADATGNGDAFANFLASSRELLLGVNTSQGGLLRVLTNHDLNIGAGNADHMTVQSDGDVYIHERMSIGTSVQRAMLTLRGPDTSLGGPTLFMYGNSSDQTESGRLRFVEATSSTSWRGAFMHYDGSANALHIGTHNTSDNDVANDRNAITIDRSSRDVTIDQDINVRGEIRSDFGGSTFGIATPVAMGTVDASAEDVDFATNSVIEVQFKASGPDGAFWNIFVNESCTSTSERRYVTNITMMEGGVDDVRATPDCIESVTCGSLGTCMRIVVHTKNAFGNPKLDYQFVVHRID